MRAFIHGQRREPIALRDLRQVLSFVLIASAQDQRGRPDESCRQEWGRCERASLRLQNLAQSHISKSRAAIGFRDEHPCEAEIRHVSPGVPVKSLGCA